MPRSFCARDALQESRKVALGESNCATFSAGSMNALHLGEVAVDFSAPVFLPSSELNRLKAHRSAVGDYRPRGATLGRHAGAGALRHPSREQDRGGAFLAVLCRDMAQIEAALEDGVRTIYVDFEDIRRYKDAVAPPGAEIFPRDAAYSKGGRGGVLQADRKGRADRGVDPQVGAIAHFRDSSLRKVGDFSLNVANPLSAAFSNATGWSA